MSKSTGWFSSQCLFVIILIQFTIIDSVGMDDYVDSKKKSSQVEVRAVFIDCMERKEVPDNDITRFQRQERFKHNALHDCNKKLALTVKIASEPNFSLLEDDYKSPQMPAEEYIPIDHVFEGPERKRVRLLNPYILRLRRDAPLQAYKLNRFDTVNCILTKLKRVTYSADIENDNNLIRAQRDTENALNDWGQAAVFTLEHDEPARHSFSIKIGDHERPYGHVAAARYEKQMVSKDCGLRLFSVKRPLQNTTAYSFGNLIEDESVPSYEVCFNDNDTLTRKKRHEDNIIIEGSQNIKKRVIKDHHRDDNTELSDDTSSEKSRPNERLLRNKEKRTGVRNHKNKSRTSNYRQGNKETKAFTKMPNDKQENEHDRRRHPKNAFDDELYFDYPEQVFALYEIGNPKVWYNVQVQLFEKLSTPDGKTVWNDLTNGQLASISTLNPEWKTKDVHLHYRPAEYVGRDEFTLPKTSLCLLEPLFGSDSNFTADAYSTKYDYSDKYIVVPIEDVIGVEETVNIFKRDPNATDSTLNSEGNKDRFRKVQVRVSRALIGSNIDNFNIANHGSERFLTLPHQRTHRAQIDVEIRADDNQLIRVGSSGRLSTIVSDHTRKTRAVLTVQATNTGLASAGFRAMVRDCGPELTELINEKSNEGATSGPIRLPPQHTQNLRLELAVEFPVDIAHCSVALVNDEDETVAVRDVAVKKGDRCFCVFHCDCVCLSEDPKLLCREMTETHQAAAGLTNLEHTRRSRSTMYLDSVILDAWSSAIGVILFLVALGLCKAVLGLYFVRIGNWGLSEMVTSTKIDSYFEKELKGEIVIYDDFGRPIHPQTHKPVRMFSGTTQFVLNLVFFVVMPGLLLCICLKCIFAIVALKEFNSSYKNLSEKCFNSHDVQSVKLFLRRRRNELQKWMTPPAEELTESIWNKGLSIGDESITKPENHDPSPMQPLLHDISPLINERKRDTFGGHTTNADIDSEQDDTLYVLAQMQKSRDSLARSQRKQNESGPSTDRIHHEKGDVAAASKR